MNSAAAPTAPEYRSRLTRATLWFLYDAARFSRAEIAKQLNVSVEDVDDAILDFGIRRSARLHPVVTDVDVIGALVLFLEPRPKDPKRFVRMAWYPERCRRSLRALVRENAFPWGRVAQLPPLDELVGPAASVDRDENHVFRYFDSLRQAPNDRPRQSLPYDFRQLPPRDLTRQRLWYLAVLAGCTSYEIMHLTGWEAPLVERGIAAFDLRTDYWKTAYRVAVREDTLMKYLGKIIVFDEDDKSFGTI